MGVHKNKAIALEEQIVLSMWRFFSFPAIHCVGVRDYPFATPPSQVNEAGRS